MENHRLDAGQTAEQPDHAAGRQRVAASPHPRRTDGVNHHEVAVEGQKSQKEDRTVEAQVVDTAYYFAHNLAKDPVGELHVGSQEGKAAHEDQGGHDQVQQEDVGHIGQLLKSRKRSLKHW